MADLFGEDNNQQQNNYAPVVVTETRHEDPFGEPSSGTSRNEPNFNSNNNDDGGFGFAGGNNKNYSNNGSNVDLASTGNGSAIRGGSAPGSAAAAGAGGEVLPVSKNVKTQDQLMAESIEAITQRGAAKYDALQKQVQQRTRDQDAKSHDGVAKMEKDAADELRAHSKARDEAVQAAKKVNAADQEKLLKEMGNLEKKGSQWELAAMHCDLSKPNSRATKSTDKMRKTLSTLVTEPNVPIGAPGSH